MLDKRKAKIDTTDKHPAYGTISLSRVSCGPPGIALFNSPLYHQNIIKLAISHAEVQRDLSKDWVHSNEEIVSVYMSNAQFGRFISSTGQGSGVPCTINRLLRDSIPELDIGIGTKDTFEAEIKSSAKEATSGLRQALQKLDKALLGKVLRKTDIKEIANELITAAKHVDDSIPFILSQFERATDKVIQDAKTEIEAFQQDLALRTGMKVIAENSMKLIDKE